MDITLTVNGEAIAERVDARTTLVDLMTRYPDGRRDHR